MCFKKRLDEVRGERSCGLIEFYARRIFSGLLYWKLCRRIYPNRPFYTPSAIRFLKNTIKPDFRIFEWGSGVSSIWYAKRCNEIFVVEHDPFWIKKVKSLLIDNKLAKCELILIDISSVEYCESIAAFDDGYFDLVAVDGRNRVECIKNACSKVKKGGYILLDDSHRTKYLEVNHVLKDWDKWKFDFGILQTSIFKKPE